MAKHTLYSLIVKFVILFSMQAAFAQGPWQNQKKYWFYKSRLNNDFTKVGLNAGESFIVGQRGQGANNLTTFGDDVIGYGDGTATLGHYLAQLATEFALLKRNGQNTDKVKHELFCALNAIDRLDYVAEGRWHYGAEMINGFFVRDDTPTNFLTSKENYAHFNYYSNWDPALQPLNIYGLPPSTNTDKGFHSKIERGMYRTSSAWFRYK